MAAAISSLAPSSRSAATPSATMPAASPRQPQCSMATAPGAARATGRQSATSTTGATFAVSVAWTTAGAGGVSAGSGAWDRRRTVVPCSWRPCAKRSRGIPTISATRSRLASTRARSSPVRQPRFRLSYGPVDTPPRRVVYRTRAPGRSIARWSPSRRNGSGTLTASLDEQREVGERLALRVLEVRAARRDQGVAQPPSRPAFAVPDLHARRCDLAVVAIRQVSVGVVVGDADQGVARGIDRGHHLARAVARLQLPGRQREVTRVAADLKRAGGGEVAPAEASDDRRVRADLPAEARHEHRHPVDEIPLARLALEAAEVVAVHPSPAFGVLGPPQVCLPAARAGEPELAAGVRHAPRHREVGMRQGQHRPGPLPALQHRVDVLVGP